MSRIDGDHLADNESVKQHADRRKQRLAALRHLFDCLVNGQVIPVNHAHTVRGPQHVVTSGQTPLLDPAEARALLDRRPLVYLLTQWVSDPGAQIGSHGGVIRRFGQSAQPRF